MDVEDDRYQAKDNDQPLFLRLSPRMVGEWILLGRPGTVFAISALPIMKMMFQHPELKRPAGLYALVSTNGCQGPWTRITINKGTHEWLLASYFSEDSAKTKLPFIYSNTAAHPSVIKRVGKTPAIYQVESGYKDTIQLNEASAPNLSAAEAKALLANGTVVILLSNL